MTELTRSDIDDLRLSADRLKMAGRFDSGDRLHTLLDAYEKVENEAGDLEGVKETRDTYEEALQNVVTSCRKAAGVPESARAVGALANHWTSTEDMIEVQLRAEVERLRDLIVDIYDEAWGALP